MPVDPDSSIQWNQITRFSFMILRKSRITFMKQRNFLFSLHFLQDLVETIRPALLKSQQNDLLSCEIRRMIDGVYITPGPSYSRLMTELNIHHERS